MFNADLECCGEQAAAIYAMADRESAVVAAMTKQSFRMVDRLSCVAAIADMAGLAHIN